MPPECVNSLTDPSKTISTNTGIIWEVAKHRFVHIRGSSALTHSNRCKSSNFNPQDVHCVVLRKGYKRSSPKSEVDTRPRKIKSIGDANGHDACFKQGYKFVDEAAKLWIRETSTKSTASSVSSKGSTPMPDWRRIWPKVISTRRLNLPAAMDLTRSVQDFSLERHSHPSDPSSMMQLR